MSTQALTEVLLIGSHGVVLLRRVAAEEPDPDACEECGKVVQIGQFPWCPHEPTQRRPLFVPFDYEGRTIDSIQAANRVERESDAAARDGRGAPIRFRAFHQDQSNYDVNTFGRSPQVPTPRRENVKPGWGERAKNREVHPAVRRIRGD